MDPRTTPIKDSAILTALPVLEDAALVIIAPQIERSPESFADEINILVPLDGVKFSGRNPIAWQRGELKGLVFDGTGRITNKGPEVHFSTLILDMSGRSVIVTLYAEEERSEAYSEIFNRIMTSLKPVRSNTPPTTPTAPVTPDPIEHADATGSSPGSPPGAGVREPRRSAREAVDEAVREASDQAGGSAVEPPVSSDSPAPESDELDPDEPGGDEPGGDAPGEGEPGEGEAPSVDDGAPALGAGGADEVPDEAPEGAAEPPEDEAPDPDGPTEGANQEEPTSPP